MASDAARSDLGDLSCTRFVGECDLPTAKGVFRLRAYRCGNAEPIVIIKGNVSGVDTLVRVHDQV
jgi:GTP cyclohydrolase II